MALLNVPIVNSTLINAQLLEKRKQFIINDCELLRREFEVYGVELSEAVLDMYRKALIVYNANVVWDLRAVSFRMSYQQTYTNNTHKMVFAAPTTYQVPAGFKSVDPITLSFMSLAEFKTIAESHINSFFRYRAPYVNSLIAPIYDNKTDIMSPFSLIGYAEIEANFQAKYGAFSFATYPTLSGGNVGNAPLQNHLYHEAYFQILPHFRDRATHLVKLFQNPTLEPKSLIPEFKKMFSLNPYLNTGIPFQPYYDFEKLPYAAIDNYFLPFVPKQAGRDYLDGRGNLLYGMMGMSAQFYPSSYTTATNPMTAVKPTDAEIAALKASYPFPATDTRTEYQKAFTYSTFTADAMSKTLNADDISKAYRVSEMNKLFIESHGGHPSLFQNLFWIISEAHASVMTTVNVMSLEFASTFRRSLVITQSIYKYRSTTTPYIYTESTTQNSYSGTFMSKYEKPMKIYIFLNDNFSVSVGGTVWPMWEGMRTISMASNPVVKVPLDPVQPFPYYMIDGSDPTSKSHLAKCPAMIGLQKLRNGFLYQDIARQFEPTFVKFNSEAIGQLESLASKQIAVYDLLSDVKAGNIYTKAITTSAQKVPFNPLMPEYVMTTSYTDVIKTSEGDMPIIHPDMEYQIKWTQLHSEMIIQSAFYYHRFMTAAQVTLDEYNNKVASYINNLIAEMKTLSTVYVQGEADKLAAEIAQTKLEVTLEKLKNGVFINDNGVEYWRALLPEEKIEMDKMVARIQLNLDTEYLNKEREIANALAQKAVDEAQIRENDDLQRMVDLGTIQQNAIYQQEADAAMIAANIEAQRVADLKRAQVNTQLMEEDSQWKRDNVDNIKKPTLNDLYLIAKANNTVMSEAILIWENQHPFYSYNANLLLQIVELKKQVAKMEYNTGDALIQAKINSSGLAAVLIEWFPDYHK